ncbi:CU044_5270 family protein [Kitasatospora sp. NPDC087315]|uniref:CU044_5270 family protein n=1 Tax=Kitasatospora sp. NPDC087315 TaxID=3364069 RepID=UPI00381DBA5D
MNEDERVELVRLLPPPARPELSADRHRLLRGHLMSELREQPVRVRRGRPGRVVVPALAGGLALALVLTGGGSASGPDRSQAPQATQAQPSAGSAPLNAAPVAAVRLLNQAADAADRAQDTTPRGDQFVYVKSVQTYPSTDEATGEATKGTPQNREIWRSVDGSRWGLLVMDGQRRPTGQDLKDPHARPDEPAPHPLGGGWLEPTPGNTGPSGYAYAAALPTDPDQLLAKLKADTKGQGPGPDQEAFATIGDILREQLVPSPVRAALYRAAARIPGVTVVDEVTDAVGRQGVAVARLDSRGVVETQWIFDRSSFEFLGERTVAVKDDGSWRKGEVTGQTTILGRAVVDQVGDRP